MNKKTRVCCSVLQGVQCVAVCRSMLQLNAKRLLLQLEAGAALKNTENSTVLQCAALCCRLRKTIK